MDPVTLLGLAAAAVSALLVAVGGGVRQVNQWETALKFTLGKLTGRVGPGSTSSCPASSA